MGFPEEVAAELERAKGLHGNMNSLHEAYAVILEEVDEFWALVKAGRKRRDRSQLRPELVQIAAMAQRAVEDLNL